MGGFAFCPGGALIKFNLFTGIKSKAASPLWMIFSINSIIQSHTVLTVLFVTQRSFPDHPSSKAFLQAADATSGALVKEELSVKEEETHGHDAVPPVTEEENPSDKIVHPVLPDAQPDYPFAVEVDSADTSPATSCAPEISGGVFPSEVMEEVPQSKSSVVDAPTANTGPEEEIPKIPNQNDSLETFQKGDEVQAAPSLATASLQQIESPLELLEAGKGATIGKGRGVKRPESQEVGFEYLVRSTPPPILSEKAIDSRIRRVFKVRADGTTLVDEQWCQQWANKEARVKLLEMFEKVGYDVDRVAKKKLVIVG